MRDVDLGVLRCKLRVSPGGTYNAEMVEKSVEEMTIEMSKRGYAFAQVRPRGDRNFETRQVSVVFVVEEGSRAYIERINLRGNTRTRDYVIRREFDIAEGDAYNRVLVDRAERRLKNLGYFKTVKITTEPGSSADRIILNVDVEEQSTGEFSVAGGYSTADGLVAEVSVGERNLLGRGTCGARRGAVRPAHARHRAELRRAVFPRLSARLRRRLLRQADRLFLVLRLPAGVDRRRVPFRHPAARGSGAAAALLGLSPEDRSRSDPDATVTTSIRTSVSIRSVRRPIRPLIGAPTGVNPATIPPPGYTGLGSCYADGEASAAVKQQVEAGPAITSLVGYGLVYNTLDNNKNPTRGLLAELRQDFAGLGGDVNFIRTTGDARYYYELMSDVVSVLRVQAGHITGWGSKDLRMLDHFQMGPNLVRGFQTAGIRAARPDARHDAGRARRHDVLGHLVRGAGPDLRPAEGLRHALRDVRRRGLALELQRPDPFANGLSVTTVDSDHRRGHRHERMTVRSSVGAGVIWDSPFGPIRVDYAFPLSKDPNDRTQELRFSGGTKF